MENEERKYILIPRSIENGSQIIEKFYDQMCFLSLLQKKHDFIPKPIFKKVDIADLQESKVLPVSYTNEELELLALYLSDQVSELGINSLLNQSLLPMPVVKDISIRLYKEIAISLSTDSQWLFQLIDFFAFLTEQGFKVKSEEIVPEDFLYQEDLKIKYFIGYSSIEIALSKEKEDLLNNNLFAFANLLNKYYLRDTEIYAAKLYRQKWFKKIEDSLIEPLLYGKYSAIAYYNFRDIKDDLNAKLDTVILDEKIAVFIDVANITTAMYGSFMKMEIDFDKLFLKIYGEKRVRNICKKIGVMFLPIYDEGLSFKDEKYNLIFEIKDYLEAYGFEIVLVENTRAAAKTVGNDKILDTDDNKLIKLMEESINKVDTALLLTGDAHFLDIAGKYKHLGKEIKLISVSEENSSDKIIKGFDHKFIYEYYDCVNLVTGG